MSARFCLVFCAWARYVRMRESQLQTRTDGARGPREMRGDIIAEVERNARPFLANFEWQSSRDAKMDERLLGYSYEATRLHGLPVLPCVIYTQPVSKVPQTPMVRAIPIDPAPEERPMIWFDFESLDVCDKYVEHFRERRLANLGPLMLLCKDGARGDILEEVLEPLQKYHRLEAISVALQFAGKVFTTADDLKYLERKHTMLRDILQESWTYQKIHGDGLVEGIEKGRVEGRVETAHKSIVTVAQARFPELLAYVKDQVAPLTDEKQLQDILSMIAIARTAVDVKQAFSTFR